MADNNGRVEVYEIKTLSEKISKGCNWLTEYRDIHSDSELDEACNHKTQILHAFQTNLMVEMAAINFNT